MSLPSAILRAPELDHWVSINDDGSITVCTGKVEIGQGITTAIAMIAAEELDVSVERIRVQTADTEATPNEFVTAGSLSIEDSGNAVRVASATARQVLLALAAANLDVDESTLTVDDGQVSSTDSNEQTDYWSLMGGQQFAVTMLDSPVLKDPRTFATVGRRHTRIDLPAKLVGEPVFVHDLTLPRMRHGRLVKPPTPDARLIECPRTLEMPGVELVRDGSFVGVIADREEVAVAAARTLAEKCRWTQAPVTPTPDGMREYLRANVSRSLPVVEGTPVDDGLDAPPPAPVGTVTRAAYFRPLQMHASMGPSAAVAQFLNGRLTVYTHSQGVELLKPALADVLGLPVEEVHVIHMQGAGCYGHNGADDVALDAALLAVEAQPDPVSVKWTRQDEHRFEPYTPAALMELEAGLDASGRIVHWRHEVYSFSHSGRPRPAPGFTNLQSAWWRAQPLHPVPRQPSLATEAGIHRNLQPIYALPQQHLVKHFVARSPLRTSAMRGLGAFANVFAIESFMDELARSAGAEPFAFRLQHLEDRRARELLQLLRSKLPPKQAAAGTGRGIALARYKNRQTYCAIAVDVRVTDDARVQLLHAVIAADAGLVIDPDGLVNQLEGGFVQAASCALKEAVRWDSAGVTSSDWDSYPILKFSEVPRIETHVLNRPLEKALGAGEASTGPTPAAIANAIFDASGIRVRTVPFTPENIRAAAASK